MKYALLKDGKLASKVHMTREAVAVEAFERGVVVTAHSDCLGQTSGIVLADGYTIEEVYTAKTSEELFEQLNK